MIRSLKVVAPFLDSLHERQELPIVRIVVLFGTCAFSTIEVDCSENPETVILVENSGCGEAACIGLPNKWLCRIEMAQSGCIEEGHLKLPKRMFGIPSRFPFDLFKNSWVFCVL
jgi:hypothetical protein